MADFFLFNLKSTLDSCITELDDIHYFVNQCCTLSDHLYNGYRLLACDGSDVNISHNPADERTFIHEGEKGYNAIHINALYDITDLT